MLQQEGSNHHVYDCNSVDVTELQGVLGGQASNMLSATDKNLIASSCGREVKLLTVYARVCAYSSTQKHAPSANLDADHTLSSAHQRCKAVMHQVLVCATGIVGVKSAYVHASKNGDIHCQSRANCGV